MIIAGPPERATYQGLHKLSVNSPGRAQRADSIGQVAPSVCDDDAKDEQRIDREIAVTGS